MLIIPASKIKTILPSSLQPTAKISTPFRPSNNLLEWSPFQHQYFPVTTSPAWREKLCQGIAPARGSIEIQHRLNQETGLDLESLFPSSSPKTARTSANPCAEFDTGKRHNNCFLSIATKSCYPMILPGQTCPSSHYIPCAVNVRFNYVNFFFSQILKTLDLQKDSK